MILLFWFWDLDTSEQLKQLTAHFKMFIYKARATGYLNISCLLIYIASIKDTEKKLRMLQKGDKNYIRIGKMF